MSAFIAMALAEDYTFMNRNEFKEELSEEEKAELKALKERKINENRGLKAFYYCDGIIWALNRKNADRKARLKE